MDFVVSNWAGVAAPKGLSPQQIAFWDRLLAATVATPAWKAFLEQNQWEAEYLPSAAFLKRLQDEEKRLRAPLTDLGLAK
jgi:putative tricarboxylic transport membrane protein